LPHRPFPSGCRPQAQSTTAGSDGVHYSAWARSGQGAIHYTLSCRKIPIIDPTVAVPGTNAAKIEEKVGKSHGWLKGTPTLGQQNDRNFERTHVMFNRLGRLVQQCRGNVAMTFALALVPVVFLTGMAIDYTRAAQKQALLNAAADAAAIAAVTPTMMAESDANAITAAKNIFNGQAAQISGLNYSSSNLNVTIQDAGLSRTATVTWSATSKNLFANVLKLSAWPISGTSQSTATVAPNINFYLLLDNSPSMNIAATTSGINTMVANTSSQGGCAFACHESNPSGDGLGNAGGVDNYTLARNLGVVTRIENMASAVQQLTTTASEAEASNRATYRMAIYTFNMNGTSTIQSLTSNMTTAMNSAANIDVLEVYQNNWLTSSNNNNDEDTDFETAMSDINSIMPTPGSGTGTDSPQEVLFIVSDGVDDENRTGTQTPACAPSVPSEPLSAGRCQRMFDTTWCTTIKNRGIRIAVLYTVYLPLPTNTWYNDYISGFQAGIAANMESCASPGLYFSVTTNGDISSALQKLFEQAVSTARLTQ
jgi:Flp pilus assembly protein TadG